MTAMGVARGAKTEGTWTELFGDGDAAAEVGGDLPEAPLRRHEVLRQATGEPMPDLMLGGTRRGGGQ